MSRALIERSAGAEHGRAAVERVADLAVAPAADQSHAGGGGDGERRAVTWEAAEHGYLRDWVGRSRRAQVVAHHARVLEGVQHHYAAMRGLEAADQVAPVLSLEVAVERPREGDREHYRAGGRRQPARRSHRQDDGDQ